MALVGEPRKGLARKAAEPTGTPLTITGVFSATHSCTRVCPHTAMHTATVTLGDLPQPDFKALRLQCLLLVLAHSDLTGKKKVRGEKKMKGTQHKDSFCITGSGIKCCLQGRAHIAMVTCSNPSQWVFLGAEDDTGGRASTVPVDGVIPAIRKQAGSQPSFAGCFTSNLCSEPCMLCGWTLPGHITSSTCSI